MNRFYVINFKLSLSLLLLIISWHLSACSISGAKKRNIAAINNDATKIDTFKSERAEKTITSLPTSEKKSTIRTETKEEGATLYSSFEKLKLDYPEKSIANHELVALDFDLYDDSILYFINKMKNEIWTIELSSMDVNLQNQLSEIINKVSQKMLKIKVFRKRIIMIFTFSVAIVDINDYSYDLVNEDLEVIDVVEGNNNEIFFIFSESIKSYVLGEGSFRKANFDQSKVNYLSPRIHFNLGNLESFFYPYFTKISPRKTISIKNFKNHVFSECERTYYEDITPAGIRVFLLGCDIENSIVLIDSKNDSCIQKLDLSPLEVPLISEHDSEINDACVDNKQFCSSIRAGDRCLYFLYSYKGHLNLLRSTLKS